MDEVIAELHLQCLDELDDRSGVNTTAEQVAAHISAEVAARMGTTPRVATLRVRLWESPQVFAAHTRALTRDPDA